MEKIKKFFTELAAKIKAAYKNMNPDTAEGRAVAQMGERADKIAALFSEGLTDATRAYTETVRGEDGSNIRYSRRSFGEQIDDVLDGRHDPNFDLFVSDTPKPLLEVNFPEAPLLMRNGKVKKILQYHPEMSAELIKKIPDAISDPVLILKSKTHPGDSVVVITDVTTSGGQMIVPIWVNRKGNYLDIDLTPVRAETNRVASAYGKNIKSLLEYAKANDGFIYQSEDTNRVRQLFALHGLQLPAVLKLSDSDISVAQKSDDVNTSVRKNSESDTDGGFNLKYSLRNSDEYSSRTIIANMLEGTVKNATERRYIEEFKENIAAIDKNEALLGEKRRRLYDLQRSDARGTPDGKGEIRQLNQEISALRAGLNEFDRNLLRLESTATLKNLLKRERIEINKKWHDRMSEVSKKFGEFKRDQWDRADRAETREKIRKIVGRLNTRLTKPSQSRYIPKELVEAVSRVVNSIDAVSMEETAARIHALRSAYASLKDNLEYHGVYKEVTDEMLLKLADDLSKKAEKPAKNPHRMALAKLSGEQLTMSMTQRLQNTNIKYEFYARWQKYSSDKKAGKIGMYSTKESEDNSFAFVLHFCVACCAKLSEIHLS